MFRLIDKTIDIIFFSINWKNYFDRSILVISMTVLLNGAFWCPKRQPDAPLAKTMRMDILYVHTYHPLLLWELMQRFKQKEFISKPVTEIAEAVRFHSRFFNNLMINY